MRQIEELKQQFMHGLFELYDESELNSMWRWLKEDFPDVDRLDAEFDPILSQLQSGRPFQYVMGEAWFMGMAFLVNESVLIPRPETEELVDLICRQYQHIHAANALKFIDIGTGSGCIALALKKCIPQANVFALDVSSAALNVARSNADRLKLDVNFMEANILEWDVIFNDEIRFDVIVSNPPYITPAEKSGMERHVLDYEPELALFVEEEAPLLFYQHIADFAWHHLHSGGKLFFEINRRYGTEIVDLLHKMGFDQVRLIQDLQGADRMIEACKN